MIYGDEIACHDDHDGYIYNHSYLWNGYGIDIIFFTALWYEYSIMTCPKVKDHEQEKKKQARINDD